MKEHLSFIIDYSLKAIETKYDNKKENKDDDADDDEDEEEEEDMENEEKKEKMAKNEAKWLNKKGFIPYIGKETILKNTHMIDNILYKEPAQDNNFKFRSVQKYKWVGKHDFFA